MVFESGQKVLWIALLAGLAVGLALGLTLTWQVWPVQYYDTDPVDLRPEIKEEYLVLISTAYSLDGDLDKAKRRLRALGEREDGQTVAALAERYVQEGRGVTATRGLARLAYALGARSSAILVFIVTPTVGPTAAPTPTPSPTSPPPTTTPPPTEAPTATPTASPTASPTPVVAYRLISRKRLCDAEKDKGRLLIYVRDEDGQGVPYVGIKVSWSGEEAEGEEVFFTGLKPEVDPGYADFDMKPEMVYDITVMGSDNVARDVAFAEDCSENKGAPSWQLVFQKVS
jgi:hypothetical protein